MDAMSDALFWVVLVQWLVGAPLAALAARGLTRLNGHPLNPGLASMAMLTVFAAVLVVPLIAIGRFPISGGEEPAYRLGAAIGAILSIAIVSRLRKR